MVFYYQPFHTAKVLCTVHFALPFGGLLDAVLFREFCIAFT